MNIVDSWLIRLCETVRPMMAWLVWLFLLAACGQATGAVQFAGGFAALDDFVKPVEQPSRQAICLNGQWQFQPVAVPAGYQRDRGIPPELPAPTADWEPTPIKIPSPWNVNTWGCGRDVGAGTAHPYWPDSVCFPSYPASWDSVEMGWLRRSFKVPVDWKEKRILLHFEAVAGDCQVFVNAKRAGEHFENFLPFDLDVTELVKRGEDNELLIGVRHPHLFDKTDEEYRHERHTYADGSYLDGIVGIWQDVYLLGVPAVRMTDVFVQPWVDRSELLVQTTVQNDTSQPQEVTIGGAASPWINEAGADRLSGPEPKWHLEQEVLTLPEQRIEIPARTNVVVLLKTTVGDRLRLWSPDQPNLYGLIVTLSNTSGAVDVKYQRFGWRQFKIDKGELLLSGRKFQVFADILHPFGVFTQSRRTAWSWFKMIKDAGGNGVRLHAQPWPSYYQDMADEMGLVVLAEDGLFGSSLMLNFTDPVSWGRFSQHYQSMVLRDRNHPSVFGWSFGNELFAIFDYNHMSHADRDKYYGKLTELGRSGLNLDPTRDWVSCDGDEDLRGTLPVWSRHFGLGLHVDALPTGLDKPLMVGESGGTYYATPSQMAAFNGERAYENYAGRNEALGIDVYQNITQMARPRLAYFSASELVWFGLEHLPLGYTDYSRLPTLGDGVFFKSFKEGEPGYQPERIPPYVTTLNPGWDPSLPLYKPLAMFDATKAALADEKAEPGPWSPRPTGQERTTNTATVTAVDFIGSRGGKLFSAFSSLGVPFAKSAAGMKAPLAVIDGDTITASMADEVKPQMEASLKRGGQVFICYHRPDADLVPIKRLLGRELSLTPRTATALDRGDESPWNKNLSLADLYFAEDARDQRVLKCGLDGDFVRGGTVLLKASDTDWSLFNNVSETAKCSAVELYEQLLKPPGAALVSTRVGEGSIAISTIAYDSEEENYVKLWRQLFRNIGVNLNQADNAWLVPIAPVRSIAWRYATNSPSIGWEQSAFDDSRWRTGEAGFGTDVPNNRTRTAWTTDDIWLRTAFYYSSNIAAPLKLVIYHDEDAEVYINGTRVWSEPGFITDYKEVPLGASLSELLKPGNNRIAVHCHQTVGGQYIDIGLAAGPVASASGKKGDHDLLLNGPDH